MSGRFLREFPISLIFSLTHCTTIRINNSGLDWTCSHVLPLLHRSHFSSHYKPGFPGSLPICVVVNSYSINFAFLSKTYLNLNMVWSRSHTMILYKCFFFFFAQVRLPFQLSIHFILIMYVTPAFGDNRSAYIYISYTCCPQPLLPGAAHSTLAERLPYE